MYLHNNTSAQKQILIHTKQNTGNWKKRGGDILSERSRQCFLTADFLPADEGIHGDGDGAVDILRGAVFGEAHFAEGFADAHYGFEVADLDGWISISLP